MNSTLNQIYTNSFIRKIIVFAILFIIALLPRLLGITFHSLWYDETSTALMISQESYVSMLKALNAIEGTPPLFYLTEKFFVDTIGVTNEFTLRFLPMFFGTVSCVLIFYIIKQISTFQNAILSFLLVTFSNFYIYLSNEARCYSLFGFLVLLNLFFVVKWWNKKSPAYEIGILLTLFFLAQVHYYAVFWIASLIICVFIFLRNKNDHKRFMILVGIVLTLSYAILIPLFINQSSHEVGSIRENLTSKWIEGIIYSPVKIALSAYLYKIRTIDQLTLRDLAGIVTVLCIIAVSAFLFIKKSFTKKMPFLQLLVFTPALIAFFLHAAVGSIVPTIHPRYMAHFLILLFPFMIIQFDRFKKLKVITIALLLIFNSLAAVNYYNKSIYYIEPYREIADVIKSCEAEKKLSQLSVITDFMNAHALAFYLKEKKYTFYGIPSYLHFDQKFEPYKFSLFGNTLYSDLYKHNFFPKSDSLSTRKIITENKNGFLIIKVFNEEQFSMYYKKFNDILKECTILKKFPTNQGDLVVVWWKNS